MKVMFRCLMCMLLLPHMLMVSAQSVDQNYISTYRYTDASTFIGEHQYFDGLGRLIGKTAVGLSPTNGVDLVENIAYDSFGHVSRSGKKVGLSGNEGKYAIISQSQYVADYKEPYAYEEYVYEASPLGRKIRTSGPGAAWIMQGKNQATSYLTNSSTAHLGCLLFEVDKDKLVNNSYYPDGALDVMKSVDEDGRAHYEFNDGLGRMVLSRKVLANVDVDTYYIYDDKGELCGVLPPEASARLATPGTYSCKEEEAILNYAYLYSYDVRHRCISKKLPGADEMTIEYDDADRPITTQTGEQRANGTLTQMSYDWQGRLRKKNCGILALEYFYDSYDSVPARNTLWYVAKEGYDTKSDNVKGLMTASVASTDNGKQLCSLYFYDKKGRVVQKNSDNNLDGVDRYYYQYTYTGKIGKLLHEHTAKGIRHEELYLYDYDMADRLVKVRHQLDGSSIVCLRQNTYDKLGRLAIQKVFDKESVDYVYNIKEWPVSIASQNFEENLSYYDGNSPEFGGNISAMTWRCGGNPLTRGYNYEYDGLSRLTAASYIEDGTANKHYDTKYTYDLMGNFLAVKRKGLRANESFGTIDDVSLSYHGNQLVRAEDNVTNPTYKDVWNFVDGCSETVEYEYDRNGNVIKDLNKQILNIKYNALNLPTNIEFEGDKGVVYVYDATGRKLQASYGTALLNIRITLDYCDNMIYENGKLDMLLVDGGYISFSTGKPVYHYYLKDHLGNNRVVVNHDTGNIEQVNHYYPYGGLMAESTGGNVQRYRYNGKELDRMHGLDWYDYGARWYDASSARWNAIDGKCEENYPVSCYIYCDNNPIKYYDYKGLEKIDALPKYKRDTPRLRKDIENFIDNPNVINVWGHGNREYIVLNGNPIEAASSFLEFLNKNSLVWQTRKDNGNMTIVLHCCQSAPFARLLSDNENFKDVTIVGPTESIVVGTDMKKKKLGASYLENNGIWKSYKNGKEIKELTYGRYDHPGSVIPAIKTNLIDILEENIKEQKSWLEK